MGSNITRVKRRAYSNGRAGNKDNEKIQYKYKEKGTKQQPQE